MGAHSGSSILARAAVTGLAAGVLALGCAGVANLGDFHVIDESHPAEGGASSVAEIDAASSDADVESSDAGRSDADVLGSQVSDAHGPAASDCEPVALCHDADHDGYVTDRRMGCPDLLGIDPGWRRCSELVDNGRRDELKECDGDPARHPGATPVCGEDRDCNGVSDIPLGGHCCADQTLVKTIQVPLDCYVDYQAVQRCSRDTACMWSPPEPVPFIRRYLPNQMLHDASCGKYETNGTDTAWRVDAHDVLAPCFAQRGQGADDIPPGLYRVGIAFTSPTGAANFRVDVTKKGATILSSTPTISQPQTGTRDPACAVLESVELGPCNAHEFRIHRDPADGGDSFTIYSTFISPVGSSGNGCTAPSPPQQISAPVP